MCLLDGATANWAPFPLTYTSVDSFTLGGLYGVKVQTEFRLLIMKVQMADARWLRELMNHPTLIQGGKIGMYYMYICGRRVTLLLLK